MVQKACRNALHPIGEDEKNTVDIEYTKTNRSKEGNCTGRENLHNTYCKEEHI